MAKQYMKSSSPCKVQNIESTLVGCTVYPAYEIDFIENEFEYILKLSFGILTRNRSAHHFYWSLTNTVGLRVRVDLTTIANNVVESKNAQWYDQHNLEYAEDYTFFAKTTENITIPKTHDIQSIRVEEWDEGWELKLASRTSYADAESFTGSYLKPEVIKLDVPAKATYTLTYEPSGGKTKPTSQTKWHGESIVLADAIARGGHEFQGWLCNIDGQVYQAGATYTGNANATFVAQWKKKRGGIAKLIDIKKLLEKILNCMYTTGSSNSWTWRKYADGTFDAWVYSSGAPSGGTHYYTNSPFYGYKVDGIYFPSEMQPIDTNYQVYVRWQVGQGFVCSSHTVSTKTLTYFTVYTLGTASSQSTVNFHAHIHGRWK